MMTDEEMRYVLKRGYTIKSNEYWEDGDPTKP